jgi:hypothetical protein
MATSAHALLLTLILSITFLQTNVHLKEIIFLLGQWYQQSAVPEMQITGRLSLKFTMSYGTVTAVGELLMMILLPVQAM